MNVCVRSYFYTGQVPSSSHTWNMGNTSLILYIPKQVTETCTLDNDRYMQFQVPYQDEQNIKIQYQNARRICTLDNGGIFMYLVLFNELIPVNRAENLFLETLDDNVISTYCNYACTGPWWTNCYNTVKKHIITVVEFKGVKDHWVTCIKATVDRSSGVEISAQKVVVIATSEENWIRFQIIYCLPFTS